MFQISEIPTRLSGPVESMDLHADSACLAAVIGSQVVPCSISDDESKHPMASL